MCNGDTRKKIKNYPVWVAIAVLVVIYLIPAGRLALWTDDLFSLTTAEDSVPLIIGHCRHYKVGFFDHPPLYFILLHFVDRINNSPFFLRLPSIIFIGVGLWVVSRILELLGVSVLYRAFAIIFLGLAPIVFTQTLSVRMYPLLFCASMAAIYIVMRAEKEGRLRWKGVLLLTLLLSIIFYTSYFGIFFAAGMGIYAILLAIPVILKRLRETVGDLRNDAHLQIAIRVFLALAIATVSLVPWLPTFYRLRKAEKETSERVFSTEVSGVNVFLKAPVKLAGSWYGLGLFSAGFLFLMISGRARWRAVRLVVAFCLLPVALFIALKPPDCLFATRYFIFSVGVMSTLAWWGLYEFVSRRHSTLGEAVVFILLFLSLISFGRINYENLLYPRPDWWGAARAIEENALPEEFILTGGFLSGEAIVYHMNHPERYSFLHYVTRYKRFKAAVENPMVVWYVNAAPLPVEYRRLIDGWFPYQWNCEGNRGGTILVASKRQFRLSGSGAVGK